jgi:hypothetical protein
VTITSTTNGAVYPPATIPVAIDVSPGSSTGGINSKSRGTTPVAVLSSSAFDAVSTIDLKTLTFGRTGYENSLAFCNPNGEDVNKDGFIDLVCHFYTAKTGFKRGDTQGVLRGKTTSNLPIEGRDTVSVVQ